MLDGLFINSSSVTGTPIRLNNNQFLRSRNFANTGDINVLKVNASNQIEFSSVPVVTGLGALALLTDISDYSAAIAALQGDVAALEADILTIEGQVVVIQTDLTSVENSIGFLQSDVNIINSQILTIQSNIVSINADISALEAQDLSFLKLDGSRAMTGSLNMNGQRIAGVALPIDGTDAVNKDYLLSVVPDIISLEARVTTLEFDVDLLTADVGSLQTDVSSIQGQVITLNITVSDIQDDVTALDGLQSSYLLLDGTRPMTGILNLDSHKIINVTDPTDPQDAATKAYADSLVAAPVTASNLGAGEGVFAQKVAADLQFKSLVAGTNISLASDADTITISSTGSGIAGIDVLSYESEILADATIMSFGTGLTVSQPSGSPGRVNVDIATEPPLSWQAQGLSVGGGADIFKESIANTLYFKSLVAGTNINFDEGTDTVTINATGSSSSVAISKDGIVISSSVSDINFTGTNITITDMGAGVVDVSVSSDGEVNTASNVGAGSGVFKQKSGVDLEFKSLLAGANVTLTPGTDSITISATGGGGGSSVSYYLNGGASSDISTYYQMSKIAVVGTNADFTASSGTTVLIAQFMTDAGDPSLLNIPAGNWNFELYFSASSGGGTPSYYVELYKYNGVSSTLIASSSATPEQITGNTSIDLYFTALAIPSTTLALTDRIEVRVYVDRSNRNITLHTQGSHLCQIITNISSGLLSLNGLVSQNQFFATGTTGTDFTIDSASDLHTFNIPDSSATARGLLTSTDWTAFDSKEANTGSNVGAGAGVFKQKVGVDLEFKSLVAGPNITITPGDDDITIEVPAIQDTPAYNEGVEITPDIASVNFTGDGVTATSDINGNVTVNIPGIAAAPSFDKYSYTFTNNIITDLVISLPFAAIANSCNVSITTGPTMTEGVDYTVSGTVFTFLASSALTLSLDIGDVVVIQYCKAP